MQMIEVFDPAMCCDTGIYGPAVDPKLLRFAADLDWLKGLGLDVQRFNLSSQDTVGNSSSSEAKFTGRNASRTRSLGSPAHSGKVRAGSAARAVLPHTRSGGHLRVEVG